MWFSHARTPDGVWNLHCLSSWKLCTNYYQEGFESHFPYASVQIYKCLARSWFIIYRNVERRWKFPRSGRQKPSGNTAHQNHNYSSHISQNTSRWSNVSGNSGGFSDWESKVKQSCDGLALLTCCWGWNHEFCREDPVPPQYSVVLVVRIQSLHQKQSWDCEWPLLVPPKGRQLAANRLSNQEAGRWWLRTEVEQWSQNTLMVSEGLENLLLCGGDGRLDEAATAEHNQEKVKGQADIWEYTFTHPPCEWLCSFSRIGASFLTSHPTT